MNVFEVEDLRSILFAAVEFKNTLEIFFVGKEFPIVCGDKNKGEVDGLVNVDQGVENGVCFGSNT